LALARIDSVASARHYGTEVAQLEQRLSWMKEDAPAWYEKPGFILLIVVPFVIWATLQTIQISI